MSNSMRTRVAWLYGFFFTGQSAVKVGLFRMSFGSVVLLSEVLNLSHLTEYYTNEGYFSNDLISRMLGWAHASPLTSIHSSALVIMLYWVLIIATICFTAGFYSQIAAVIMFILLLSFDQRDVLLLYGGDRLQRAVLFFCMFLQSDQALSLRNWLGHRKTPHVVPGWPVRLIQIQVAFVYFFTAIAKLGSLQWRDGTFLYAVLNNPNFALFHIPWIKNFALPLGIMTFGVLALELSFIFLVWWRKTNAGLLIAVAFEHIGIMLTMNVTYFSQTLLPLLVLCLDDSYMYQFIGWWTQRYRSHHWWLPVRLR